MAVFTDAERAFLAGQRIARLATADPHGTPDVSAVGFRLEGDLIMSGGLDLTKTIRYRHLQAIPVARMVIDDLVSADPWTTPRGGEGSRACRADRARRFLDHPHHPKTIWSWGINEGAAPRFANIERRTVS
jgi:PPOX class F420-dependent enzyme/OxyR family protein